MRGPIPWYVACPPFCRAFGDRVGRGTRACYQQRHRRKPGQTAYAQDCACAVAGQRRPSSRATSDLGCKLVPTMHDVRRDVEKPVDRNTLHTTIPVTSLNFNAGWSNVRSVTLSLHVEDATHLACQARLHPAQTLRRLGGSGTTTPVCSEAVTPLACTGDRKIVLHHDQIGV